MQQPTANHHRLAPTASHRGPAIAVRFGDAILEAGHTAIPNLALNHYAELGLTPAEMLFVIHVWQFWWTERTPFPSLGAVADRMRVSRRQVRTYVAKLKERGLLVVHERTAPGHGQVSSEYDFAPFLAAVVKAAEGAAGHDGGGQPPPRKDSSEGPRKSASYEEDEDQEDEDLSSKCAREGLQGQVAQRALPPREVVGQPNGPVRIADILAGRLPPPERPTAPLKRPGELPPPLGATPYLDSVVDEVTEELHDQQHHLANVAQARRLLRRSQLAESEFVQRLYRARALTKERLAMPEFRLKRPAAYFFVVLRDLLALPNSIDGGQGTRRRRTTAGTRPHEDAISGVPGSLTGTDANRQRHRVISPRF